MHKCVTKPGIPCGVYSIFLFLQISFEKKELLKQWIINMKRDKWYPLCSLHFEDKYIINNSKRRSILPTAIPTIFYFPAHLEKKQHNRPLPKERQNTVAINVRTTTPVSESEPINMELNSSGRPKYDMVFRQKSYTNFLLLYLLQWLNTWF